MPNARGYSWRFKTRFRRHAFGWKSQPAITRLQEALAEIKQVARLEPLLAAEGAIALLERISPALEHVDSSSGAIGSAVNRTIAELVPIIAGAPADARPRAAWLDRVFEAHAADQVPYIEQLAEYSGDLCGSRELSSEWADRLITITRLTLSPDKLTRGYFHGTSPCLSALFTAGRYDELIELVQNDVLWSYKRWPVKALAAQGQEAEAIAYAERCRSPWASDSDIDGLCEQILQTSGHPEEAYARYAISANRAATYLGWFRAVAKTYPDKPPVPSSWRTAFVTRPVRRASGSPPRRMRSCSTKRSRLPTTLCDPKTLTRAARDFARTNPAFAVEAGLAALRWLVRGYGHEVAPLDVRAAYSHTLTAAANAGVDGAVRTRIRALFDDLSTRSGFVASVIGKEVGLD
jgi:hypothetical protein